MTCLACDTVNPAGVVLFVGVALALFALLVAFALRARVRRIARWPRCGPLTTVNWRTERGA
jgi:hypothetical protein